MSRLGLPLLALFLGSCGAVFERTIVFIHAPTSAGQNVFMRGGISSTERVCVGDNAALDPCAIPIQTNVVPTDTSSSYYQWSQGDNHLDWYGAETGQGDYTGTAASGTPLVWTTSLNVGGAVDQDGYGYTPYNRFGEQYWMLDVNIDCAKTEGGWFEFKTFRTPLLTGGWEQDISQYTKCAGEPNYLKPYVSSNHLARCGMMNLFYEAQNECNIWSIPPFPHVAPQAGCGERRMFESTSVSSLGSPAPLIVNGNPATIGRWPWQGVLQYGNTIGGCAGVLIDNSWAITAAHCVSGTNPAILKIRFGEQNLMVTQGNEQAIQVQSITMHPMYQNPGNAIYNDYDVAMLRLQTQADITDNYIVNSACLPYGYGIDGFVGDVCWATGFGDTKGSGEKYRMNEINVPVWSFASCTNTLGTDRVSVRQICMGTNTESACGGDSGGPLVCHSQGKWVLVGTTSWGTSTCSNGPSVYSRITEFVSWIDSVRGYSTPW